jgi:hypothetical protein
MKTKLAVALVGFALGVPGVAVAAQPHVDFTSWTVRTIDGKRHTGIVPGSTFKHCKSKPAVRASAIGDYSNATVGAKYRSHWYVNQLLVSSSVFTWKKTHGTNHWTLYRKSGNPIPDGQYLLSLTQSGQSFAHSSIKIATKKRHGKPC